MAQPFRSVLKAFKQALSPVELVVNDETIGSNLDLVCDSQGVLYTRSIGAGNPAVNLGVWEDSAAVFAAASGTLLGSLARPVAVRRIEAIAGDPAVLFSAAPVYLQLHTTLPLAPGDIPEMVYPVPIPPGMLVVDLSDAPIINAGSIIWAFSTTLATYTAGPTGYARFNTARPVNTV